MARHRYRRPADAAWTARSRPSRASFSGLRTGRASTDLLDPIRSRPMARRCRSTRSPPSRRAGAAHADACRCGIEGLASAVEKAIREAGLGLNPHHGRPDAAHSDPGAQRGAPQGTREARGSGMRRQARVAVRNVRRDGDGPAEATGEGAARSARTISKPVRRGPEDDRRHVIKGSTRPCSQGAGDHAGVDRGSRSASQPSARPPPAMSPSSWTAMAAGRRRAACRAPPATRRRRGRAAPTCARPRRGAEHLTLYAFSTENWKRPATGDRAR